MTDDDRRTSAPAHSESWGVVGVKVHLIGIALHERSRSAPLWSANIAPTSLDSRWGRILYAIVLRVLYGCFLNKKLDSGLIIG